MMECSENIGCDAADMQGLNGPECYDECEQHFELMTALASRIKIVSHDYSL